MLAGFFANFTGQSVCNSCPIGSFSVKVNGFGPLNCTVCPAGRFSPSPGLTGCLDCQLGRFAPSANATQCSACDPGTAQGLPGQSACVACDKGQFALTTGVAQCAECDQGKVFALFRVLSPWFQGFSPTPRARVLATAAQLAHSQSKSTGWDRGTAPCALLDSSVRVQASRD